MYSVKRDIRANNILFTSFAFNKIDKPEANVEKVKQQLSSEGIVVESYGGKVPEVATSAVSKQGIQ